MSAITTMGELRERTKHLSDDDLVCLETIDLETGDVQDLYPFYVDDNIDGIQLKNGNVVKEVRFTQMKNNG